MGIDIQLRIDLSPLQKRILRWGVVTGSVVAALGLGLAIASPHQWSTSDPLKAADLNSLNVATTDAGSYSVGATLYCGSTPLPFPGNIGGYAPAKKACEATCTSPTAHMCGSEELVRSSSLGMTPAAGWYANGTFVYNVANGSTNSTDCLGWTSSAATDLGPTWEATPSSPQEGTCDVTRPILCCD